MGSEMYIGFVIIIIIAWFVGGAIYREHLFSRAAMFRAERYNALVKAMENEFGEHNVATAARKHEVALYCEPIVKKGKWGARLGW